jgi:two-component system, probable response regulator PhcQ
MAETPLRKILVVDDEEHVCSALRRSLRNPAYDVHTSTDARQALELIKVHKFDLIISDHLMPHMSGLQFLKLVRDRHPDSVRIMLTGHSDMQTAIEAINQGDIYRFLTKPWDNTDLKVTLHLAFEKLDLERENRRMMALVRQLTRMGFIDERGEAVVDLRRDKQGVIVIDEDADTVPAEAV